MEIIKEFFDEVMKRLKDESYRYHNDYEEYSAVENFDFDTLVSYKNKISNKLLAMSEENRKIYANLILESIDYSNIQNRILMTKDVEISDEDSTETYKLITIGDNLVNIKSIWDYCTVFISLVWEAFKTFGIDLKDIVKEKKRLRGDYSFFFKDPDYVHTWALEQQRKDKKEYKNTEFTAQRQLLAIESMLSELSVIVRKDGRYSEGDFDKISLASFLQFITGREADSKPKDTRFYKMINSDSRFERANYNNDCDYVARFFEKLGLDNIATKVKNGKNEL